jgi:hypothetical protein
MKTGTITASKEVLEPQQKNPELGWHFIPRVDYIIL